MLHQTSYQSAYLAKVTLRQSKPKYRVFLNLIRTLFTVSEG